MYSVTLCKTVQSVVVSGAGEDLTVIGVLHSKDKVTFLHVSVNHLKSVSHIDAFNKAKG